MSAGPIAQERASHKPAVVSTPDAHRVCMSREGRGYCGRGSAKTTVTSWSMVTCADCLAAARADGVEVRR